MGWWLLCLSIRVWTALIHCACCFSTGHAVGLYLQEGLDAQEGTKQESIVKSLDLGIKTSWVLIYLLHGLGWPEWAKLLHPLSFRPHWRPGRETAPALWSCQVDGLLPVCGAFGTGPGMLRKVTQFSCCYAALVRFPVLGFIFMPDKLVTSSGGLYSEQCHPNHGRLPECEVKMLRPPGMVKGARMSPALSFSSSYFSMIFFPSHETMPAFVFHFYLMSSFTWIPALLIIRDMPGMASYLLTLS